MKKLESYLLDNMEVTYYMVRELNAWAGSPEHSEYFMVALILMMNTLDLMLMVI